MKALAEINRRQISTAPMPDEYHSPLGKPYRGRLHAVPPQSGDTMRTPMLTTEEFIQVRLATVRESTRHRYWPADVVARFAAADVIR